MNKLSKGLPGIALLVLLTTHLQAQAGDTLQLWVDGICGMCKDRIENAVYQVPGVAFADWDVASRTLTITQSPEPLDENQLHQQIASVNSPFVI